MGAGQIVATTGSIASSAAATGIRLLRRVVDVFRLLPRVRRLVDDLGPFFLMDFFIAFLVLGPELRIQGVGGGLLEARLPASFLERFAIAADAAGERCQPAATQTADFRTVVRRWIDGFDLPIGVVGPLPAGDRTNRSPADADQYCDLPLADVLAVEAFGQEPFDFSDLFGIQQDAAPGQENARSAARLLTAQEGRETETATLRAPSDRIALPPITLAD